MPGQPTGCADGPGTGPRANFVPGQPVEPGLLVGLGPPAAQEGGAAAPDLPSRPREEGRRIGEARVAGRGRRRGSTTRRSWEEARVAGGRSREESRRRGEEVRRR